MTFVLPSIGSGIIASPTAPAFSNAYSVDFDGTDDFVSTSSFDLTTNKTVSFWIKLDSISSAGVYLFGKGASYYSYITSNGRTMYKYDGSSAKAISISAADAITTGVWQHIVITGDGSSSVLYKNGSSIGTGVDLTPAGLDRFAGDSVGGSRFVDGLMDEVAVWNATLSADDVTAIYNSGVPNDLSDASSYDTDRTSNLVHWWRMGDNDSGTGTTITDQGSGGNNGTLTNGPTFSTSVPPTFNTYSVEFDGTDDYVEVGNVSGLTGTSFSISAWFYLTANPSGEGVFGAGSSSSDRIWLQVLDSDTIRFGSRMDVNTFDLSSGTFSLNTWYHVVGVIDGTSKEVFIDGSSLGTTTVSSLSGTNGNNVRIGSLPSQTSAFGALNPYQGILDEVAVFNTALSSSDISSIYNSGVPNDISSLSPVGWWRMGDNDGGTGATITDQGSGGNDGTLTNGPTFSTDVP